MSEYVHFQKNQFEPANEHSICLTNAVDDVNHFLLLSKIKMADIAKVYNDDAKLDARL